jgi:hypothetical protein
MEAKQLIHAEGFRWWAVTGSNCGPPACKLVSLLLYRLSVPNNFNNFGRLLSLSR